MVTEIMFTKDINKELHKEFMKEDFDKFIKLWLDKKELKITFSRKSMEAYILQKIWNLLDNKKPLCKKMNLTIELCKKKLKRKKYPQSVINLIDFYGEMLAYKKSLRYNSLSITFSWKVIEQILAEDLFKAGHSAKQVSEMLDIHIRKSFRIQKRLKDNGCI